MRVGPVVVAEDAVEGREEVAAGRSGGRPRSTSSRHTLDFTSGMNSRNASRVTRTSSSAPSSSSSARTLGVGRLCASSSNHEVERPQAPATSASSSSPAMRTPLVRRGSAVPGVVAHDEHAQRRVTDERGDVHRARQRPERVEVLGKRRSSSTAPNRRIPTVACLRRTRTPRSVPRAAPRAAVPARASSCR